MRDCSGVSNVASTRCGTPGRGVTLALKSTNPVLRISMSCVVATNRSVWFAAPLNLPSTYTCASAGCALTATSPNTPLSGTDKRALLACAQRHLARCRFVAGPRQHDAVTEIGPQLELQRRLAAIHAGDGHARARRVRAHREPAVRQAELDGTERQRLVRLDLDIRRPRLEPFEAQFHRMRARHDLRFQRRDAARLAVDDELRAGRLRSNGHDAPTRHELRLERLRLAETLRRRRRP